MNFFKVCCHKFHKLDSGVYYLAPEEPTTVKSNASLDRRKDGPGNIYLKIVCALSEILHG